MSNKPFTFKHYIYIQLIHGKLHYRISLQALTERNNHHIGDASIAKAGKCQYLPHAAFRISLFQYLNGISNTVEYRNRLTVALSYA